MKQVLIFTAVAALAYSASAQSLILNGGFELTPAGVNIATGNPAQEIFSSGWMAEAVGGGSTAFTIFAAPGFNEPNPADGTRLLSIGGFATTKGIGLLWQDFATTPGQEYAVEFYFGRSNNSTDSVNVSVDAFTHNIVGGSIQGGPLGQVSSGNAPATGITGNLTAVNFEFTATGSTTRLLFDDQTANVFGPNLHLDGISVTAVPEPSTMGLVAGLVLLGLAVFRRRGVCKT